VPVAEVRGLIATVDMAKAEARRARLEADKAQVAANTAEVAATKAEVAANTAETVAKEVLTRWGMMSLEECSRLFDEERPDLMVRTMRPPGWPACTSLGRMVSRQERLKRQQVAA
jgi:hypothetical protein